MAVEQCTIATNPSGNRLMVSLMVCPVVELVTVVTIVAELSIVMSWTAAKGSMRLVESSFFHCSSLINFPLLLIITIKVEGPYTKDATPAKIKTTAPMRNLQWQIDMALVCKKLQ